MLVGELFELGGGWISRLRLERSLGYAFNLKDLSANSVAKDFERVGDFQRGSTFPNSLE